MSRKDVQYIMKSLEAIAIFGGGGGSSLGARQAGFKVIGMVDICPHARNTHELNDPGCVTLGFDMQKEGMQAFGRRSIRKGGELARHLGIRNPSAWDGLILFTSPCTGFSNGGDCNPHAESNYLVLTLLPLLAALPKASLIFENVLGFCHERYTWVHERLFAGIEKIRGIRLYAETLRARHLLNATSFGLAQNRKRIVFPIRPDGYMPAKPLPTCLRVQTLRDAIHPASGFVDPDPRNPTLEGEKLRLVLNMRHDDSPRTLAARDPWVARLAKRKEWERKGMMDLKTLFRLLHWDEPAHTLVTDGNYSYSETPPLHPCKRMFTVGERLKLQGFPLGYRFDGKMGTVISLIGNSVPPPMFDAAIRAYFEL